MSLDTATAERAETARTDALRTVCAFNFWPPNVDLAVKQTKTTIHIHYGQSPSTHAHIAPVVPPRIALARIKRVSNRANAITKHRPACAHHHPTRARIRARTIHRISHESNPPNSHPSRRRIRAYTRIKRTRSAPNSIHMRSIHIRFHPRATHAATASRAACRHERVRGTPAHSILARTGEIRGHRERHIGSNVAVARVQCRHARRDAL